MKNSISICLDTVSVKHTVCSATLLFSPSHFRKINSLGHTYKSIIHTLKDCTHTSYIIITFIYTRHQPIFQVQLNPQYELQNNNLARYNNTCRPKRCRLRHSLDPNQYRKYATPPTIMPRSSTTHYNHQECCLTWRTSPDKENIQ